MAAMNASTPSLAREARSGLGHGGTTVNVPSGQKKIVDSSSSEQLAICLARLASSTVEVDRSSGVVWKDCGPQPCLPDAVLKLDRALFAWLRRLFVATGGKGDSIIHVPDGLGELRIRRPTGPTHRVAQSCAGVGGPLSPATTDTSGLAVARSTAKAHSPTGTSSSATVPRLPDSPWGARCDGGIISFAAIFMHAGEGSKEALRGTRRRYLECTALDVELLLFFLMMNAAPQADGEAAADPPADKDEDGLTNEAADAPVGPAANAPADEDPSCSRESFHTASRSIRAIPEHSAQSGSGDGLEVLA
ncbi:uncharacterized protein MKK02DRAFT_29999 [Dioszegia hungarica]|uniref:Uncharacterized protein n=1 Tax=Dioszegia hungarica TaxID=4972 RepID=A0AA38LRX6_9TREE|nr:uncharacterized protein MKK02DRAFT_29999 [Dioszegia hungarica]KAI9633013.1 hypothetical protein MKK02DRAFT_29999 [Dioszegia hungarica]